MTTSQADTDMDKTNNTFQDGSYQNLPGSDSLPASVLKEFDAKRKRLGTGYLPRTRHKTSDGSALFTNRLFLETSPYLAQHAHNPVNWFSWGEEAFRQAEKLKRPVLVSIGYSTCHWCHVMEEESFEDLEIADYLNRYFICIKVDREERPDVDSIYMTAVQAMTGSGGWPLNVAVTHDRKPFWGGTYFPPRDGDRGAAFGFLTIMNRINQVFSQAPQEVEKSCKQLTEAIERFLSPPAGKGPPGPAILNDALEMYKKAYDQKNGGVQGAPKFPSSLPLRFLLRAYQRTGHDDILEMATRSLKKMAAGGIYDQVGGGFHRYATDASWLVPHFEKMLYDNGLLAVSYIEAYQASGAEVLKETAVEILEYVLREMTSETGAFYSATDADSLNPSGVQEEGYFFTWTPQELIEALGSEKYQLIRDLWGVTEGGNFEGRTILNLQEEPDRYSAKVALSLTELKDQLKQIKQLLYLARNKRHQPLRDDKIIVSWNGLMISAFAIVGDVLGENRFVSAAEKAAEFINDSMVVEGRLYRTWKDGEAKHTAFLSDYSNFIGANLDLFRATQDIKWLNLARQYDRYLASHFEDLQHGGFFMTGSDQETLITREKPLSDGALPSGNSIAVNNLLRLYRLTMDSSYKSRFDKAIGCFLGKETGVTAGYSEMLAAFENSIVKPIEIVIVVAADRKLAAPFYDAIRKHFLPQADVFTISCNDPDTLLQGSIPYLVDRKLVDGKTTAYICEEGSCQMPETDPERFDQRLTDLIQTRWSSKR